MTQLENTPKTIRHRESQRHKEAFEIYYASQRDFRESSQKLAINQRTLYDWCERYNWRQRADERDEIVLAQLAEKSIKEQIRRLEEHLKAGTLARLKGLEWMAHHEIDSARDALAFVKTGIEIERQAEGLPSIYMQIASCESIEELEALEVALGLDEDDPDDEDGEDL